MDQKKIGSFLKELRKERNLTQEQLAEIVNVSGRTVSRWETGSNMPDLDILIQLSDYYDVDIKEVLDGERKGEKMNKEMEDMILKVADYSNEEKEKITRRMHILYLVAVAAFAVYLVLDITELADSGVTAIIGDFLMGVSFGMLVCGAIFTSRHMRKIREFKMRLLKRK